jgi:hypothetical protein
MSGTRYHARFRRKRPDLPPGPILRDTWKPRIGLVAFGVALIFLAVGLQRNGVELVYNWLEQPIYSAGFYGLGALMIVLALLPDRFVRWILNPKHRNPSGTSTPPPATPNC